MKPLLCLVVILGLVNCATSADSTLESAQFALDSGDYDAVIAEAANAPFTDTSNVKAARILSSAYFGRSGLDFLTLSKELLDLSADDDSYFQTIGDVLVDADNLSDSFTTNAALLADLRSAIEILQAVDGIDATIAETDDELLNAVFDLGLMEAVEHFARGVYTSDYGNTFSLTGFTTTDSDAVQADLVNFDNHLEAGGLESDNALLTNVRKTFCILKDISATSGFTLAEYESLVGCQLKTGFNPATETSSGIANCAVLLPSLQSASVQACFDADTSL